MDIRTEMLLSSLDEMTTRIITIQSLLRSGHDMPASELDEWAGYIERHAVLYTTLMLILAEPETVH